MDAPLAKSWTDFTRIVRELRQNLGSPTTVWYRGHSKTNFLLRPSLFRRENGLAKERDLYRDYEQSASYLQPSAKGEWDMLNDMQHYGIPTRLLDWTDVLGVAVAFALYDDGSDHEDSIVYVLDPIALNKRSNLEGIKRARDDATFKYKDIYWEGRPFSPIYPIAVDGLFHNDRLRAQRGFFTVQGWTDKPLDEHLPDVVQKVILSSAAKPEAREFLEHANLNPFSIYPDTVGMARHITRKHLG